MITDLGNNEYVVHIDDRRLHGQMEADGFIHVLCSAYLFRASSTLTMIPGGICFAGGINLAKCVNLKIIDGPIKTLGSLSLSACNSLERVGSIDCWDNLNLAMCRSLQSLPNNLQVRGNMLLPDHFDLDGLPEGFRMREGTFLGFEGNSRRYTAVEVNSFQEARAQKKALMEATDLFSEAASPRALPGWRF